MAIEPSAVQSDSPVEFTHVKKRHYMIVDVSNLLHRTFYVHTEEDFDLITAAAYKSTFLTLNKYYKDFTPDTLVLAFDDHNNWRKKYTNEGKYSSEDAPVITNRPYKGTRRQNQTPDQKKRYGMFLDFVDDFEQLLKDHTSIICLHGEELEADDLIAGFSEIFGEEHLVTIVSQDKDLYQLLKNENVQIVDPAGKGITTGKDLDVEFMLFEKFFRGDTTDNVQNAYPGVRTERIKKAYIDSFELANILQHKWRDPKTGIEYKVGDLFVENKKLMDLTQQPDVIRDKIYESIEEGFAGRSKYSHFHFLAFLGKYDLRETAKHVQHLIPLLSH